MKTKVLLSVVAVAVFATVFISYGNKNETKEGDNGEREISPTNVNNPLNISIYLDLSDRLTRNMAPSQKDRDLEIVNYIAEYVKNHSVSQKIIPSKDRIKVFFYPTPADPKIALLSSDLEMDLSKAQPADKKKMLKEFQKNFNTSLTQIYDATLQAKDWPGSDIWGFFRKQVDTYCVREDSRNIIVILTDGYIFHAQNKVKVGNNYSYITPATLKNPNSGLIAERDGLDNIEVLMLEVNPIDPKHQDQMERILQKWFSDMGVQKFYVGETDLPSNTKLIIDKFLKE
ncbi:MAG: hypothetical protein K2O17_05270 [Bacteroidaceae bacterium]|nr:hypothetical protein [Bacteroidaceae bacterium]